MKNTNIDLNLASIESIRVASLHLDDAELNSLT